MNNNEDKNIFAIDIFEEKSKHSGYVSRIFKTTDTWSAGLFYDTDFNTTFKFVSHFKVELDRDVVFIGEWTDNHYNGITSRQFIAKFQEKNFDLSNEGLYRFLKNNPDIKGIGEKIARKIANKYWENFNDVIVNHPNRIIESLKIHKDTVDNLRRIWMKNIVMNQINIKLSNLPLSQSLITKLIRNYGANSFDILKQNPYNLIYEIDGMGFKTADEVALFLKFPQNSEIRIHAGLEYILRFDIQEGFDSSDCWISSGDLLKKMVELLNLSENIISDFLINHVDQYKVKIFEDDDILKFSYGFTFYEEEYVIKYINEIKNKNIISNSTEIYDTYLESLSILNDKQKLAVQNALKYNFSIITGKAGTGKTFVIQNLIHIFRQIGLRYCLVAPTGKAARRIEESVNDKACTIHRLLKYNSFEYLYNEKEKIYDYDVFIVDEFSMVNNDLAYRFFSALPDYVKIIIVGDHNQLPPIGPGLLFTELLNDKKYLNIQIVELTEVIRQAGALKKNSTDILSGQFEINQSDDWMPMIDNDFLSEDTMIKVIKSIYDNSKDLIGFDYKDIQLIVPKKNGIAAVHNLNIEIQKTIQEKLYNVQVEPVKNIERPKFYLHDKVIQTVNNYDIDVMNGTLGEIVYLDEISGITKIKFEGDIFVEYEKNDERLDKVSLAYALTIHKVQGSEFPCIIILMHKSQKFMLDKNLLYTAVTRASKKALIISDSSTINFCLNKNKVINKKTNFKYIVKNLDKK